MNLMVDPHLSYLALADSSLSLLGGYAAGVAFLCGTFVYHGKEDDIPDCCHEGFPLLRL
ncbi:MAG: hypothetical protein MZV63_40385 [Marinilabiliales bacterium]|nr:hypothetical protein [Marinilabiliales bacterium]